MNDMEQIKKIIEAGLFAAGKPMNISALLKLFDEESAPEKSLIKDAVDAIQRDYVGRGVELKEVGSGFRFQVVSDVAPWISRLWEEKPPKYSRALLETLALIAYRQPITRSEIEEIRGVSVSTTIIKTLQEREWIRIVGHKEVPGRPALYATSKFFLDYFNLKSLDELPPLSDIRDLETLGSLFEESGQVSSDDDTSQTESSPQDELALNADAVDPSEMDGLSEEPVDESEPVDIESQTDTTQQADDLTAQLQDPERTDDTRIASESDSGDVEEDVKKKPQDLSDSDVTPQSEDGRIDTITVQHEQNSLEDAESARAFNDSDRKDQTEPA